MSRRPRLRTLGLLLVDALVTTVILMIWTIIAFAMAGLFAYWLLLHMRFF